jgi:hypothetical protein
MPTRQRSLTPHSTELDYRIIDARARNRCRSRSQEKGIKRRLTIVGSLGRGNALLTPEPKPV